VNLSKWIFGLTMLVGAGLAHSQNQFSGMGFYFGNPTPEAVPIYNSFVTRVKQLPNTTTMFVDYRQPIWLADPDAHQWSTSARWSAKNLALLTTPAYLNRQDAQGRPGITPILSIGLTDEPTAFQQNLPVGDPQRGKYSEAAAVRMMKDIANGKYDSGAYRVWPAILDAYRENGFHKIYLRIGWEQNGDWYGWRARSTASRDAYIAAWRHVANLAHTYAVTHGMIIETVWSPSASFANFGLGEESTYPGDAYVDIIAPTGYSSIWNATRNADRTAWYDWSTRQSVTLEQWYANAVNRKHSWDYPASDYWNPTRGWGISSAIAFAMSRNKPFGLSETGTGNAGMVTQGGGPVDEGDYPIYLAERLAGAMSQGLKVEFVDVWAQATGSDGRNFLSGSRPKEAQAWKEFGPIMAAATSRKNIALNKPTLASSTYSATLAVKNINDGKSTTRWSSKDSSLHQWLRVDLGQRFTLSRIRLNWDAGYASSYRIQISNNGSTWSDVYVTTTGNGGTDDLVGLAGVGRYVRVLCSVRQGSWTYSLREIEIYP
jgi:F5/8 type C domain/Glycosyl hydrolase family 26